MNAACIPLEGTGEPQKVVDWGGDIVRNLNGQVPISASISHDARLSPALNQVIQPSTGELGYSPGPGVTLG